ncbi:MAG: hypothetical protein MZV70_19120 [Desulfobacterales bacterium]|nr:hypothetical protein [Desulfobacterales bacterium]
MAATYGEYTAFNTGLGRRRHHHGPHPHHLHPDGDGGGHGPAHGGPAPLHQPHHLRQGHARHLHRHGRLPA